MAQKKTKKKTGKKRAQPAKASKKTAKRTKKASKRAPVAEQPKGSEPVHRLARDPHFPHDATVDQVAVPDAKVDRRRG